MKVFSWRTRVYWEDTDAGGVVYYANYLRFMERARTEWLRNLGYCQRDLATRHGVLFAVTRVRIDYRRPARLDDELLVTLAVKERRSASMLFGQEIVRGDTTLVRATVRVACVDLDSMRPVQIPPDLFPTAFPNT